MGRVLAGCRGRLRGRVACCSLLVAGLGRALAVVAQPGTRPDRASVFDDGVLAVFRLDGAGRAGPVDAGEQLIQKAPEPA
jgi:hypothetical protein